MTTENGWIRKEVWHLAENLNTSSRINVDALYAFLMDCGRAKGCNPRKLDWVAGPGVVFLKGERDTYCIETYHPEPVRPIPEPYDGMADHYYDLIMERQESWYDE